MQRRPADGRFGRCGAKARAEILVICSLRASDAGPSTHAAPPGSLCRNRRAIGLPLDERSSCAPVFGVHGVCALPPGQRRRCPDGCTRRRTLVHAHHARPTRLCPDRVPLGRPVPRLASRLLQGAPKAARDPYDTSTLSFDRRPDRGPPHPTGERGQLHRRVAEELRASPAGFSNTERGIADG